MGSRSRSWVTLIGAAFVAGLLLAGIAFPLVGGVGQLSNTAADSVTATAPGVESGQMPSLTTVTDDAGTPIATLFDQNRQVVSPQQISVTMKGAIVAIEDQRFFSETGVDPRGVARALVNNSNGGGTQGASTLTQQYVKNYDEYVAAQTPAEQLKATAPDLGRKIREAQVALQLDKRLSKEEILTRYLNVVFLGNNAYGVQAAARTYFDTTADRLTIPQAALLAGMVQSPAAFDPVEHPQAATNRRNTVIDQMTRQGEITPQQGAQAAASPLGVDPALHAPSEGCIGAGDAGFFCSYVLNYLDRVGISPDQLRGGGYTIRTTMNRAAMNAAKAAVDAQVPPTTPHVADTLAYVLPGPTNHPVTALVANRGYGLDAGSLQTTYDLPAQPEPLGAGSVYKIFTSATYLSQGGGIQDVIPVPAPTYTSAITPGFTVQNAESNPPTLTLQDALARSPNTAFVKLEERTGIAPIVDTAVRLGMRSLAEPTTPGGPSIADTVKAQNQASFTLGPTPTSPLELANVGATLASHGTWCPPNPIQSITDANGRPVPLATEPCSQAVAPQLADTLMTGLSKDDQPGGTSQPSAQRLNWTRPTAAKTGTTQNAESGVFVGVTPQLSGASVIFDDSSSPRPICEGAGATGPTSDPPRSCGMGTLAGGLTPARTYYQAATTILGNQPAIPLPPTDPRYVTGGPRLTVPNVIGQGADAGAAAVRRAGFTVVTASVDSRAPAGTVVGETPLSDVVPGQSVTLSTSTGRVPAAPPPPPPPS